jgi:acyl dehydratase
MTETRTISDPPSGLPLMAKAVLPVLPGVSALPGVRKTTNELPDLELRRPGVAVDPGHVAAYSSVCGFARKDTLPLPYLHMLAFPLHMALLTDSAFPFPAMGTVHLENTITQHRPSTASETYDVSVRPTNLRPHAKGQVFDMVTEVRVGEELVWDEVSTYLRRGKGDDEAPAGLDLPAVETGGVDWRLPADLGRRYGAVSGDRNPIHLYPWSARALGFKRQIAHGMWTKARSIAAIENRLPDRVSVEVAFKTPVFLPGVAQFRAETTGAGTAFSLVNPKSGAPHLHGRAH